MSKTSPDPFSETLAALLAPLSQAMVAQGVTLSAATSALKLALLNAALEAEGPDASDSRISVMTGLHRKDVRRLRTKDQPQDTRKSVNRLSLLMSHWATSPDFQDPDGSPRALLRDSAPEGPGFNELVRRVPLDSAPGTILQMMLDHGAVTQDEMERIHLASTAFVPSLGSKAHLAAYRATLLPHLTAATANLLANEGDRRYFDRIVQYSHLSDRSVLQLEQLARQESGNLLEKLSLRAHQLQEADAGKNAQGRFAAGAYIFPTPGDTE